MSLPTGENGLTVAPGDVEGWRAAIERLHRDDALRQRLGRNARRWVEENATLDHWAMRLAEAISQSPHSCASAEFPVSVSAQISPDKY